SESRTRPDSSVKHSGEWMHVSSEASPASRAGLGNRCIAVALFGALIGALLLAGTAMAQGAPADSSDALRAAREASDRKDFDQAAAILQGALRSDPDDKEMLSLLARVQAWS